MQFSLVIKGRKGWLDAVRCLAIIFVVYGHCAWEILPQVFLFIGPVKIPLFLAISGYLINTSKRLGQFLKSLTLTTILPWLVLGWIRIPFLVPSRGWDYLLTGTIRLLTGEDLWFMPFFIIAETLHFCLRKYVSRDWLVVLIAFALSAAGLTLGHFGLLDTAMVNRALTAQPFFLTGYFFRKYEDRIIRVKWIYILLAAAAYFGLCLLGQRIFGSFVIDVHLNMYPDIPYTLILIFGGCLILFTAARKANFQSWITSFIGQNTLVIYLWSGASIAILSALFSRLGWDIPLNGWTALFYTAWACLLCGFCSVLINGLIRRGNSSQAIRRN